MEQSRVITLTSTAEKNFKRMRSDEGMDDSHLRVAVKGGGCAGYEYVLNFGEPTKKDLIFNTDGLPVVVDKKSYVVVKGLEIDWSKDLSAPGPRFFNPKATSTCGCSTSFSIKSEVTDKPVWMN